jgi:metal-responsive CopG/Arc/MetJ family transcriptional regulator
MNGITRTTNVISISLPQDVTRKLERTRKQRGQSRSAFISALIDKETEVERWRKIYEEGAKTARRFNITSEDDIDRILHEP